MKLSPRPVRPAGWWLDALMAAGFIVITLALFTAPVRDLDLAILHWVDGHRPGWAQLAAQLGNRLGQGGLLTLVAGLLAITAAVRRRCAWLLGPVVLAFLATGVVLAPLKLFFHRAAPHAFGLAEAPRVRLFSQSDGLSYLSGHAVNTVVWYGVITLLITTLISPRRLNPAATRWLRVTPVVLVGFTATYLGYHWFTDMLAGVCLGVLLDRLLTRVPWPGLPATPG